MTTSALSIMTSPDLEFHRHFDQHVHRNAASFAGRESPVAHRLHRTGIEAMTESLQQPDFADRAIASDDDLHHHVALHPAGTGLLGVVGLDLVKQRGGRDAAARPKRSAAGAAARSLTNPAALAFTHAGAGPRADTAIGALPAAVRPWGRLFEHARTITRVGRRR